MDGLRTSVNVTITKNAAMEALYSLGVGREDFDHRQWSIWDAEILERVAKKIREGYAATDSKESL